MATGLKYKTKINPIYCKIGENERLNKENRREEKKNKFSLMCHFDVE